ncbi:sensor histidine kinase [Mucilaginibacter sp. UYCu711]|uniref:sensor histidine kinase n=1 Tax=Mucilaginibacter sp. UYCu711 TaxID=3156339 RepID=UPI003D256FB0
MHRSKLTGFIIHAAGWLMFLGFPLLFMNRTQDNVSSTYFVISSPYYWLFCLTYIFMFYLNAWYLVPQFVFRKKYFVYGVIVLLLSGSVYYLQPFDNLLRHNLRESPKPKNIGLPNAESIGPNTKSLPFGPLPHQDMRMQDPKPKPSNGIVIIHQAGNIDMVGLFIFIVIMGLSIAVSTVQKWQFTEQRMVKAEAEKATAELSFLKAQINPHFLFNTLNNIYALSVTGSEHTSASIMKLSNIMRYVTDEVEEDEVSLQHEWDCINDYIDLQRLRLGKKTKLNFELAGTIGYQRIAPLILMTFIENVFKYGISKHEATNITIKLTVEADKLSFFSQNSIIENGSKLNRTGIGIKNTRQRLNHIYPGKHRLDINTENNLFTVHLEIDC